MHSLESLREIRAMELVLGSGNEKDHTHYRPVRHYKDRPRGTPIATVRYNLATRERTIVPSEP